MAEENIILTPEEEVKSENEQRAIRLEKLEALQQAGKDPFEITLAEQTITAAEINARFEELENSEVTICGRIMTWRDMGKANFIDVMDGKGRIQCYIRINDIGEEAFEQYKKWDIGDIVGD